MIPAHEETKVEEYEEDIYKEVPILYSVKEIWEGTDLETNGYDVPVVTSINPGEFLVINSRERLTTDITVKKIWEDNNNEDGIRPDHVVITLLQDDIPLHDVIITDNDDWKYTFEKLPLNKEIGTDGKPVPYRYEVVELEENIPEGYSASSAEYISDKNYWAIKNTHTTSAPFTVKATKVWEDEGFEHLETDVTFILMKRTEYGEEPVEGENACKIVLNDPDQQVCEWTGLDRMENGKTIVYTVKEEDVPGYVSSVVTEIDEDVDPNTIIATVTNTYVDADKATPLSYLDPKAPDGKKILKGLKFDNLEPAKEEADKKTNAPDDPIHDGYKFLGWDVNFDPKSGYVLVAKYNKETLVTYIDPISGEPIVKSEYTEDIHSVTDPNDPSHDGYTFTGWKDIVDSDGNHMRIATFKCNCASPGPGPTPCPVNPTGYTPPRTGIVYSLINFFKSIFD